MEWQAVEIVDPYGDGLVTFDEFRLAVLPGEPLRAMRLGGFAGVGGSLTRVALGALGGSLKPKP